MNNISFKAETIKGEIIEACCVINKHNRLLLSNEAKAGFWIECKPDTLQVVNKNGRLCEGKGLDALNFKTNTND